MIRGAHPPQLRATRALFARLWSPRRLCGDGSGNHGSERPDTVQSDAGGVHGGGEEVARLVAGRVPREVLLRLPRPGGSSESDDDDGENFSSGSGPSRRRFFEDVRLEADRIFRILLQDGPGFSARQALDEMRPRVSNALVREVLFRIVASVDTVNRERYPKLAYKFFMWAGQQEGYRHGTSMYNLVMKVFAECGEVKAMWRLFEEMADKGLSVSARTFHLLICASGQAGLRRRLVERFIKSSTFNYRPFRNAFNAILHTLLTIEQYSLIEWVHQKMLLEGHLPDVLTYNVVMRAKYMLGKLDQFHRLLDEMGKDGLTPDLHTYNLLLHVLGKGDKPLAALNLLNYMSDVGCVPNVLHFTNLIDGLGRAGNLEACKHFFDEMIKKGCEPDVVCYTVMITGYVAAGEFEEAQRFFDDMLVRGQLPNVYTYNSMIRGLCTVGEFDKAFSMLKDMDSHGCTPNFSVYSSLVSRLRNAGKDSQANNVIKYMTDKGHYFHLLSRFGGYRRC
ncbi:pentatricopeptide repeat-containing protein At3g60050-like [Phragmites australis]|uniref:pentatricopeptide repeat-containing protein At3g60050-like n=1 Tax=Phragmites australis TaxID=29695 RepID=UPI002D7757BB|nr:pentatricopeptide repeat-containing protein At3g60050-like [Phragmites australis]